MPDSSQTEKPTPRRLLKAREEGRFAVSREFVAAVQFTAFVAALAALGPRCFDGLQQMMRQVLAGAFRGDLTIGRLQADLLQLVLPNLFALGLMAILLLGATLATQVATTQLGFALAHLSPDFSRLDPLKRLRSLPRQNLPAFLQALVLLPVFLVVLWGIVQPNLPEFLLLPLANPAAASARVFGVLQALLWKASFALLLLGVIDLVRQRRHYVADLRMSKQEIREEHKELEGNPQIKIADPPLAARPAAAKHDEGNSDRHGRDRQPDALCGRHPLQPRLHGGADGGGEGQELPGAADQAASHRAPGADHRKSAAGAGALQSRPISGRRFRRTCTARWPRCWLTSSGYPGEGGAKRCPPVPPR